MTLEEQVYRVAKWLDRRADVILSCLPRNIIQNGWIRSKAIGLQEAAKALRESKGDLL